MKPEEDDAEPTAAANRTPSAVSESTVGWGRRATKTDSAPDAPGRVFEGALERRRYDAVQLLGRGGMGEVHLARDARVGRSVALKVLLDDGVADPELHARFVREALIQGQLEHPGIVPVYDIEPDANGRSYFAMKRVAGETLDTVVRKLAKGDPESTRAYSLRRLLSVFQQVCLTIHYAHTRGVVHRDIKLSNLMVGDFGEVYVLDWGIAKLRDVDEPSVGTLTRRLGDESFTRHDHVLGTVGYIPPEQIADPSRADARSDVYALGAVLFALLTRKRLHGRGTPADVIESTQRGADARASVVAPDLEIPPELDAVCVKATALRPEDRYESARALHDAVERFLEGDRDVRLRAELAEQHLVQARRALAAVDGNGASAAEARRSALRQAGRALALQPDHAEAGELLASMMLAPPDEVPEEVARASRELGDREQIRLASVGLFVVLGVVGLFGLLLWVGVRSWTPVLATCAPVLLTIGVLSVAPSIRFERKPYFAVLTGILLCSAIAASSTIAGPLWLPALFATTYAAIIVSTHGLGRWRLACVAMAILSVLAPFGLEVAGLIPAHYAMHGDHAVIFADAVHYPWQALPALALASVANVALVSFALWRFSDGDMRSRRELQLVAWHFRQVAPLRDSTRPPPRSSVPPGKG